MHIDVQRAFGLAQSLQDGAVEAREGGLRLGVRRRDPGARDVLVDREEIDGPTP